MIEGLLTFAIGIWAFFYMPASPTQTITRWRKKSWFTEREEIIIVNKVLRDDPTKSSSKSTLMLCNLSRWEAAWLDVFGLTS